MKLDQRAILAALEAEKRVIDEGQENGLTSEAEEKSDDQGSNEVVFNPRTGPLAVETQPQLEVETAGFTAGNAQLTSLIEAIKLPSVQLMSFSGDPMQYWPFIQAFDDNVDKCSIDSASKLTRLIHYCNGPARKVIECCTVMPPEAGYARARELLKERFGDSFQIPQTWVRKITIGPQVKANNKVQL